MNNNRAVREADIYYTSFCQAFGSTFHEFTHKNLSYKYQNDSLFENVQSSAETSPGAWSDKIWMWIGGPGPLILKNHHLKHFQW